MRTLQGWLLPVFMLPMAVYAQEATVKEVHDAPAVRGSIIANMLQVFLRTLYPPAGIIEHQDSLVRIYCSNHPVVDIFFLFLMECAVSVQLFFQQGIVFGLLKHSLDAIHIMDAIRRCILVNEGDIPQWEMSCTRQSSVMGHVLDEPFNVPRLYSTLIWY